MNVWRYLTLKNKSKNSNIYFKAYEQKRYSEVNDLFINSL